MFHPLDLLLLKPVIGIIVLIQEGVFSHAADDAGTNFCVQKDKHSHTSNCSEDMNRKGNHSNLPALQAEAERKIDLPGYPLYPANEDIFSKYKEEKNINPEDTSQTKASDEQSEAGGNNEKDFNDDVSGSDLDVPGSELDDEQERNGNEDEENNYYSLGGDGHKD